MREAVLQGCGKRALVAMSGGVDSSVAAKLLMDAGFDVFGITMVLIGDEGTSEESKLAKGICEDLGIGHMTFDLRGDFDELVETPFCEGYLDGITPNPCVLCNKHMKFKALHAIRSKMGFDFLATGHYARRRHDQGTGLWQLRMAKDRSKDQTYFIYNMTQEMLEHTLFPLGDLSKSQTRNMAEDAGLSVADRKDSQDVCFIRDRDRLSFIYEKMGIGDDGFQAEAAKRFSSLRSGRVVDCSGNELGHHEGLINYTLGQRKGIGIAAERPLYVIGKDEERSNLIVGFEDDLLVKGFKAGDVVTLSEHKALGPSTLFAKSSYRQEPKACKASLDGNGDMVVMFDRPVRVTAPGQSIVLYDGDVVVAGATISEIIR